MAQTTTSYFLTAALASSLGVNVYLADAGIGTVEAVSLERRIQKETPEPISCAAANTMRNFVKQQGASYFASDLGIDAADWDLHDGDITCFLWEEVEEACGLSPRMRHTQPRYPGSWVAQ